MIIKQETNCNFYINVISNKNYTDYERFFTSYVIKLAKNQFILRLLNYVNINKFFQYKKK